MVTIEHIILDHEEKRNVRKAILQEAFFSLPRTIYMSSLNPCTKNS